MRETEDNRLIRRIKEGDRQAFERLVRKHYQAVFSYCYRRTGDRDTAADLTQEVFLKLVAAIYRYAFTGKFTNFLYTIAVNTCHDHARKKELPLAAEDVESAEADEDPPDAALIRREERGTLYQRLSALPDEQKDALILRYYHDLKMRDIAKITGVPVSTVKSRVKRGLDKLRKIYQEDEEDV